MILDVSSARRADSGNALSRRGFLHAGAAAGGLMLSLSLPFATGNAETGGFAPNAFIRIGNDGRSSSSCPMSRWGRALTPPSRC